MDHKSFTRNPINSIFVIEQLTPEGWEPTPHCFPSKDKKRSKNYIKDILDTNSFSYRVNEYFDARDFHHVEAELVCLRNKVREVAKEYCCDIQELMATRSADDWKKHAETLEAECARLRQDIADLNREIAAMSKYSPI